MSTNLTFHALAAPLLATHPAAHSLFLRFEDATVEVRSNSSPLVAKLGEYYRDFPGQAGPADFLITAIECPGPVLDVPYAVKEREPGKTKIKEEFVDLPDGRVVRKILTGLVFMFGHGGNYAFGPCLDNDNQVVNFINNRFIERVIKKGALLFHAAGVAVGGRGLCLVGFSGAGKSTLALEIMRHGTDFISNDRVMVARESGRLTMTGVAKMPRINPGTVLHNDSLHAVMSEADRVRFSALPEQELWDLEHKYDAFIDTCFGPGRFRLKCDMAGLAILHWKRDGSPLGVERVNLRERRDLMPAFMKDVGLFFEMDDPAHNLDFSEEAYLDLLGDCPVLEFTGGVDFAAAAKHCLDFLHGGGTRD